MKREEFDKIIGSLNRTSITDEDIEFLSVALGVEDEDDIKVKTVESILTLASTNIESDTTIISSPTLNRSDALSTLSQASFET